MGNVCPINSCFSSISNFFDRISKQFAVSSHTSLHSFSFSFTNFFVLVSFSSSARFSSGCRIGLLIVFTFSSVFFSFFRKSASLQSKFLPTWFNFSRSFWSFSSLQDKRFFSGTRYYQIIALVVLGFEYLKCIHSCSRSWSIPLTSFLFKYNISNIKEKCLRSVC